ncbi:MAG: carbohydrate ABC transporter permease, partial [Clostridia bacterium]|nr:carbohydrate ABC transporter permease [Clostridia bacterium]
FNTFIKIILPLSVPMMITIFLFAFSWQWTDDFYTKIFFTDATHLMPDIINKVPLSLTKADEYIAIKQLYTSAVNNTSGIMIILPLVIVYLFCQKYLVQGIERSGLVG